MSPPASTTTASAPPCALPSDHQEWFRQEVHPHERKLKAYLRSSFPSVADVEDVVQESYVRIWKRKLTGPVQSAPSFLFRIARNLAIDLIRRRQVSPETPVSDVSALPVLDQRPDAAESVCTREELDALLEAIDSLPPRCREILILRKLHGLSVADIARKLGIAEGTVLVQGGRGVRKLAEILRGKDLVR